MILITGANGQLGTELHYLDRCVWTMLQWIFSRKWISLMLKWLKSLYNPTLVYHYYMLCCLVTAEDEGKSFAINMLLKML